MRSRYLVRRGDTFYFRLRVPDDVRQHFPAREIVRSLHTTDRRVAAPQALVLAAQHLQQFHSLRMSNNNRFDLVVKFDYRPDGSRSVVFDDVQPHDIETVRTLAQEFAPEAPKQAAPAPTPSLKTPLLSEAVAEFLEREAKSDRDAMLKKHKGCLPVFLELVGDVRLHELKQRQLNSFFEDVTKLPKTWHLIRRREKLSIRQIIEREWPGIELLGPKSFRATWRPSVSRFLSWAKANYHDDGFPVGLTLDEATYSGDRKPGENKQRALKPNELKRMFEGPEMQALADDPAEHHKFWLPLLCLYTGSRINEIAQLNPQTDIKQDSAGIWYFELSEESEAAEGLAKSIKTGVTRRVPIHSKLIELGFLSYLGRVKATGSKLLFPAWSNVDRSGKLRQPGDWFRRRFLTDLGLHGAENEAGKALRGAHAFRHTFLSYGHAQGLALEALTHKLPAHQSGVVSGYIDGTLTMSLAREKALIDALDYGLTIPAPFEIDLRADKPR